MEGTGKGGKELAMKSTNKFMIFIKELERFVQMKEKWRDVAHQSTEEIYVHPFL